LLRHDRHERSVGIDVDTLRVRDQSFSWKCQRQELRAGSQKRRKGGESERRVSVSVLGEQRCDCLTEPKKERG